MDNCIVFSSLFLIYLLKWSVTTYSLKFHYFVVLVLMHVDTDFVKFFQLLVLFEHACVHARDGAVNNMPILLLTPSMI